MISFSMVDESQDGFRMMCLLIKSYFGILIIFCSFLCLVYKQQALRVSQKYRWPLNAVNPDLINQV